MGSGIASLQRITAELVRDLATLRFSEPITHVYNPLEYAAPAHSAYVKRYARAPKTLLLGMNPGPFGMAQTGVPFGEVAHVRDWLGIEEKVGKPKKENTKRPIEGFACARSEVSGARLWGWAKARFGTPDEFFARFFVVNYCPLVFMEASGRNFTPDKLPPAQKQKLFAICDRALQKTVAALAPERVVGIGKFAEQRAREALAQQSVAIGGILHPSPASPMANANWAGQAEAALQALGAL